MRSALAAVVLAVLAFGPSVDGLTCQSEGLFSAAAAETLHAAAPGHADDAEHADVCVHGHCHHAAAFLPDTGVNAGEPDARSARRAHGRARVGTSDAQFGLKRPPRA